MMKDEMMIWMRRLAKTSSHPLPMMDSAEFWLHLMGSCGGPIYFPGKDKRNADIVKSKDFFINVSVTGIRCFEGKGEELGFTIVHFSEYMFHMLEIYKQFDLSLYTKRYEEALTSQKGAS